MVSENAIKTSFIVSTLKRRTDVFYKRSLVEFHTRCCISSANIQIFESQSQPHSRTGMYTKVFTGVTLTIHESLDSLYDAYIIVSPT